jgi:hypothetical protein
VPQDFTPEEAAEALKQETTAEQSNVLLKRDPGRGWVWCLEKGSPDAAVAADYRHRFDVGSTQAVRQFIAETSDLVAAARIALWIDGARVLPQIKRQA